MPTYQSLPQCGSFKETVTASHWQSKGKCLTCWSMPYVETHEHPKAVQYLPKAATQRCPEEHLNLRKKMGFPRGLCCFKCLATKNKKMKRIACSSKYFDQKKRMPHLLWNLRIPHCQCTTHLPQGNPHHWVPYCHMARGRIHHFRCGAPIEDFSLHGIPWVCKADFFMDQK